MSHRPPVASALRRGFTTGACATAAVRAAYSLLSGNPPDYKIPVLFPNGQVVEFKLSAISNSPASASVVKDAGDDPDVTDKAVISACVSRALSSDASEKDYVLNCGDATLILRGGSGVGLVTRPGLSAENGKWAINPVPRNMILSNLKEAGFGLRNECVLTVVEIENGADIAGKTLNPVLGIIGGISILGTSGFVEPYSNSAYIETIKVMISGAKAAGLDTMVLSTGGSTLKAAMALRPELPEHAFVRIADFMEESLRAVSDSALRAVIISCMEGKLLKYACGLGNTHAWKNAMQVAELKPFLLASGLSEDAASKAVSCPSVREALSGLGDSQRLNVVSLLAAKAIENFKKWTPSLKIEIDIFDSDAKLLMKCDERPL